MEQKAAQPVKMESEDSETSSTTEETTKNQLNENEVPDIVYSIKEADLYYDKSLALAEKYKSEGNEFFKKNQFLNALEKYSQAIDLKIETKKNAIYYSNRAFVNLNLENFGSVYLIQIMQ